MERNRMTQAIRKAIRQARGVTGGVVGGMIGLTGVSLAQADYQKFHPTQVEVTLGQAYLPDGFDSNDNVQVVVEGEFTNTCFRPATPKAEVDPITSEIRLTGQAYYYDGFCLQMLVPYDRTLDLGILPPGDYKVIDTLSRARPYSSLNGAGPFTSTARPLGALKIREAKRLEADDFLYAPVEQAYVEKQEGAWKLHLTGSFTSSCARIQEVKVDPQSKVLVVLPITQVKAENCGNGRYPFHEVVSLPTSVAGRHLVHVRTLNGKALNVVTDLD